MVIVEKKKNRALLYQVYNEAGIPIWTKLIKPSAATNRDGIKEIRINPKKEEDCLEG